MDLVNRTLRLTQYLTSWYQAVFRPDDHQSNHSCRETSTKVNTVKQSHHGRNSAITSARSLLSSMSMSRVLPSSATALKNLFIVLSPAVRSDLVNRTMRLTH